MSTFWIFAAILTAVYVAYYIITICIDLYRKPKDQNNASAEYFDVDDMPAESSKAVEETESGFRVANDNSVEGETWHETELQSALKPDSKPVEQTEESPITPPPNRDQYLKARALIQLYRENQKSKPKRPCSDKQLAALAAGRNKNPRSKKKDAQ